MSNTTEIWKLAQRLEPELWARLADGSIPEDVVDGIISDRLETAEKCIVLREQLMDHCVTIAVEAAVKILARDLTFGEDGSMSYTPDPSRPCWHCGETVNDLCPHHHAKTI